MQQFQRQFKTAWKSGALPRSKSHQNEASKLQEYTSIVERSLQAAEIISVASISDNATRHKMIGEQLGLVETFRCTVSASNFSCNMSVMIPLSGSLSAGFNSTITGEKKFRYNVDETIICMIDNSTDVTKYLNFLSGRSRLIPVHNPSGFVTDKVRVHEGTLLLAEAALRNLSENCYMALGNRTLRTPSNNRGQTLKQGTIRVVGSSVAGGVSALMAMLLDGAAKPTKIKINDSDAIVHHTANVTKHRNKIEGKFHNAVRCFALGPPPCISRGVVPSFVTSLAYGDDFITRVTESSLDKLRRRIISKLNSKSSYMSSLAGKVVPRSFRIAGSIVSDLGSMGGIDNINK